MERAAQFLDVVADQGITDASLLSISCWTKYSEDENTWALWLKGNYKRINLRVFGSFFEHGEPGKIPYEEQAKSLLASGCDGIKLLQMKPEVRKELGKGIDHESYDAAFDFLEREGVPILLHSGDPENLWEEGGAYFDGGFISNEQIYQEVFARLDKNPRLNMVIAHFFFLSNFPERAEAVMEKYPTVKFDLTPGWEMFLNFSKDIEGWHRFFEKYSDRILFGTDSNNRKKDRVNAELNALVLAALSRGFDEFEIPCYGRILKIRGLGLSQESIERITSSNYFAFLGNE
jgi:hypothetical protein